MRNSFDAKTRIRIITMQPIDIRTLNLPFRVGTTSYIIPADLIPNARFLASRVQDMQLVLFDRDDGLSNLPTPDEVETLAAIGRAHDLTYTVHLIRDLRPDPGGGAANRSLADARRVIELTRHLDPVAYVLHLDGREVRAPEMSTGALVKWRVGEVRALTQVADWAGGREKLAVENLEGYPPDFVTQVVAQAGAGRCVDVGHLWLDGRDPLPWLRSALPRTRVIHLHGVMQQPAGNRRDHVSLAHIPPARLDPVVDLLLTASFTGVLTLEVFERADFDSSLEALMGSIERC